MELRTKIKSKLDLNYLNQYNNETNETNEMNTNNIKFVENEGNCLIDLIVYATKNKLQILFSNEKEVNIKLIIHDPDHNCKVLEWFIQLIEFQNSFYTNIYEDDTNEIVSEINRYIEKRNKRLDIIDKAKLAISKLTSEELDYIMEYKELIKEHPEYIY
jgi:hypothetical protein